MRLSYYGGGHYDSIVVPDFPAHIVSRPPGEIEDAVINRLKSRLTKARGAASAPGGAAALPLAGSAAGGWRTESEEMAVVAESDIDATDREALEFTIQLSRQDLGWAQEDIESAFSCPTASWPAEKSPASSLALAGQSNEKASSPDVHVPPDLVAAQEEMLKQAVSASEDEYLASAILSSMANDNTATEEQLLEQVKQQSSLEFTDPVAEDPELALALKLSNLSEEEALEYALKESISGASHFGSNPAPANQYASASSSSSGGGAIASSSKNEWIDIDSELLQAALSASMEGASAFHAQESEDELLYRAIAESLKK